LCVVRVEGGELNEAVVRAFLHDEYPRIVGVVTLLSGDAATAEDAVSEALARAWERAERGERIESLGAWVTTVAMNLSRSRWRRVLAERRARARMGNPEAQPEPEGAIDLRRALGSLPRRQREVVLLHYYLGFDVEAAARHLDVRPGTVKSALHRARAELARRLGVEEENHVRAR
jgi:RNA polymerase sigma-70 factor (ECF subfamily)